MVDGAAVRPIFVLGSPRSGTTAIGSFVGSSPAVYNIGEYRAFFAAHLFLPQLLVGISPPEWAEHRQRYLHEVQEHAAEFARRTAAHAGCAAFCDSAPRNVLVARQLSAQLPDALFVLMLRHYSGVVQSLARSRWAFAGDTWSSRATVWAEAYEASAGLPDDRTVAVSYDALCEEPAATLAALRAALTQHGVDGASMDATVLATSYAQPREGGPRPTVVDPGTGALVRRLSYDAAEWSAAIQDEIAAVVAPAELVVRARWSSTYRAPSGFGGGR